MGFRCWVLVFDCCVFIVGWRHDLRSEAPYIIYWYFYLFPPPSTRKFRPLLPVYQFTSLQTCSDKTRVPRQMHISAQQYTCPYRHLTA